MSIMYYYNDKTNMCQEAMSCHDHVNPYIA